MVISVPGAAPIRHAFRKVVTTIGADESADVCIGTVSRQWAIVKRQGEGLELRLLESGETHRLPIGGVLELEGVRFDRRAAPSGVAVLEGGQVVGDVASVTSATKAVRLPVDRIALRLGDAERVDDALRGLLDELLAATGADRGALVLRDRGAYSVPVARDASGEDLAQAEELLSDTLVRDVLETGEAAFVHDAPQHERYAEIPSVASLELRTMLCAPMTLGGQVLGAIFLGKRHTRTPLHPGWSDDLRAIGSMVLPLLAQLRRHAGGGDSEFLLVGEHPSMQEVRRLVQKVGPSDLSVLVLGDTGTGKEMVARALHAASPRRDRPMVALNCSAVPESLLGGELFGAKKGAYTGAVADRAGVIERADGSTLFLDEVGDMPAAMQAMLLRVLEDRKVTRLGDGEARSVDFRLVAATHKDLHAEVEAGRFRQDLLFRLQELTIDVPSLCERGDDVLLLASLFLRRAEKELGMPPLRLSPAAERAILGHRWPGNVRELRAAMRRAALLCEGEAITPDDLRLAPVGTRSSAPPAPDLPLAEAREKFVRDYVLAALARHEDNREAAAVALGISLRTLYRYLED